MISIQEKGGQRYVKIPLEASGGDLNSIVGLIADDGNHYLNYGIIKNSLLLFDTSKEQEEGALSVYKNDDTSSDVKYKLSETAILGFTYFGRLVFACHNYEVS